MVQRIFPVLAGKSRFQIFALAQISETSLTSAVVSMCFVGCGFGPMARANSSAHAA
jgi:hypothetical protein